MLNMRRSTWFIFFLSAVMVNNPTQQDVPAFYSPLTHDQHAQLGRIAVLWGQVDTILDNMVRGSLRLDPEVYIQLFGDRPFGSKLEQLKKALDRLPEGEVKAAVSTFMVRADKLKSDRNRAFHGTWGFFIGNRKVEAAAQHHKAVERPFKAQDLPRLERALCQLSHLGMLAASKWTGTEPFSGAEPLFHGGDPRQAWFEKWLEQHRTDHPTPDHRWKPGRLPFLEHPLK